MCALEASSAMLKKINLFLYTVLECVGRVCAILFYDKLKIDLVCVLSCCSCVQTGVVEFLVMKRTFALRYTARRPKAGQEAIQTMQEGNIISRFC